LPLDDSRKKGKDSVGLISLVDRAYARAYKLHSVYSNAMRFHCAARWISNLQCAIGRDKNEGWGKILRSLVNSETGTYQIEHDRITIIGGGEKVKVEEFEHSSPRSSQGQTANTTLF